VPLALASLELHDRDLLGAADGAVAAAVAVTIAIVRALAVMFSALTVVAFGLTRLVVIAAAVVAAVVAAVIAAVIAAVVVAVAVHRTRQAAQLTAITAGSGIAVTLALGADRGKSLVRLATLALFEVRLVHARGELLGQSRHFLDHGRVGTRGRRCIQRRI